MNSIHQSSRADLLLRPVGYGLAQWRISEERLQELPNALTDRLVVVQNDHCLFILMPRVADVDKFLLHLFHLRL